MQFRMPNATIAMKARIYTQITDRKYDYVTNASTDDWCIRACSIMVVRGVAKQ